MEAQVGEWFTTETLDLEIGSLDKNLYSTLSLFNQVYKWVPATYQMDQLSVQGGVTIPLGMLHTNKTGISYGCLGLWLTCTFTFNTFTIRKPVSFFSLRYDFYVDFLHQQGVTLSSGISYSRLSFCLNCHKIIV